jgi:hypothetical protein
MLAEGNSKACELLDKTPNLIAQLFDESKTSSKPFALSLSKGVGGSTSSPRTGGLLLQIESYAEKYRFFHYEVAFPEAFAGDKKGFDIIVGNPPWDKTKFSDADFFPQFHSNYRSLKNSEKAAVQTRLLDAPHISAAYKTAQRDMEVSNAFYKAAYPLNKGAGDGNLFRFFVERNLSLLSSGGSLNYVLPSALLFEEGSMALRQHIFSHCQMPFFYSFENRNGIFPDVDSRYKFALMQVVNSAPNAEKVGGISDSASTATLVGGCATLIHPMQMAVIDTAFYVLDAAELHDPARHIAYPLATLKALSPQQWALMELRDGADLPILQKCYAAFPALSPDWLDFRNELHMTADKDLFKEEAAAGRLPLYQGKTIWQYSNTYSEPEYWLDKTEFDARIKSKELYRMAQDLGVNKEEVSKHEAAIRYDREFVRLGVREIASDTNERTLIFALCPKDVGVGHKVNISIPKTYCLDEAGQVQAQIVSPLRLLFALACFNSLTMDWVARFMIQISVSKTYLYRLPMPQPTDEEIRSNPVYAQLAKHALLLSLAADWDSFAELAPLFDVQQKDLPKTDKARDKLRAENDKLVATLYGITPAEFAHLLKSFKVLANKRPEYLSLLV